MAYNSVSPLSLLREYTIQKKYIGEEDGQIIFGDISWPKETKTNYRKSRFQQEERVEYYTLECLLFWLQNISLQHPVYVKKAVCEGSPQYVQREDKRDLLGYLLGELESAPGIDRFAPLERPNQKRVSSSRNEEYGAAFFIGEAAIKQERGIKREPSKTNVPSLPTKVIEQACTVELVQDFLQSGILILEGGFYCFFFRKDYISNGPLSANGRISEELYKGKKVFANAKLVKEGETVPFIATTVWDEGVDVDANLMAKVFMPITASDLEKYNEISPELSWSLPSLGNTPSSRGTQEALQSSYQRRSRSRSPVSSSVSGHRNPRSESPSDRRRRSRSRERSKGEEWGLKMSNILDNPMLKSNTKQILNPMLKSNTNKPITHFIPSSQWNELPMPRFGSRERKRSRSRSRERKRSRSRERRRSRSRERRVRQRSRSRSRGRRPRSRSRERRPIGRPRSRSRERQRRRSRSKERNLRRSRSRERRKSNDSDMSLSEPDASIPILTSQAVPFPIQTMNPVVHSYTDPSNPIPYYNYPFIPPQSVPAPIYAPQPPATWSSYPGYGFPEQQPVSAPVVVRRVREDLVDLNEVVMDLAFGPIQTVMPWRGMISEYLTPTSGIIKINNTNVYFHANQLMVAGPTGSYNKVMEVFPSEEVKFYYDVGMLVYLNVRKIPGQKKYLYQATAIWKDSSNETIAPLEYNTKRLLEDLDQELAALKYSEIHFFNKESSVPKRPFNKEVVKAKVHEFFDEKIGLLKIEGPDGGVVLHHQNQVSPWTKNRTFLPIGTTVLVNTRKLPVNKDSELAFQAIVLWPVTPQNDNVPIDWDKILGPMAKQRALSLSLDRQHDYFKKEAKLHLGIDDNLTMKPVPVVLNGLSFGWTATVIEAIDEQFGVILIDSNNPSAPKMLYCLFHVEDVLDPKRPNMSLNASMLVNKQVDLTARSICHEYNPREILEIQRSFHGLANSRTPLLQAISACIKETPDQTIHKMNIAKPTYFSENPGTFNPIKQGTPYYFNLSLRSKLDSRLDLFLTVANKMEKPYDPIIKPKATFQKSLAEDKQCKNGLSCSKKDCQFLHGQSQAETSKKSINPENAVEKSTAKQQCKYGIQCKRPDCWFEHDEPSSDTNTRAATPKESAGSEVKESDLELCPYGRLCERPNCRQVHPWQICMCSNNRCFEGFHLCGSGFTCQKVDCILIHPIGFKKMAEKMEKIKTSGIKIDEDSLKNDDDYEEMDSVIDNEQREVMRYQTGKIVQIINDNYGIAVGVKDETGEVFKALFDIHDVWIGSTTCAEEGKVLGDVMAVGDFVRFHAFRIKDASKEEGLIKFMATTVITSKSLVDLPSKFDKNVEDFVDASQISKEKIEVFMTVVKAVSNLKPPKDLDKSEIEVVANHIKQLLKAEVVNDLKEFGASMGTDQDVFKKPGILYRKTQFCYHCKLGCTGTLHASHIEGCANGEVCISLGEKLFSLLKEEAENRLKTNVFVKSATACGSFGERTIYRCHLCNLKFCNLFNHIRNQRHLCKSSGGFLPPPELIQKEKVTKALTEIEKSKEIPPPKLIQKEKVMKASTENEKTKETKSSMEDKPKDISKGPLGEILKNLKLKETGAGACDKEQRQKIVQEVLVDLIAPSVLAKKYKISAHSIRDWVKKTGKALPKEYKKAQLPNKPNKDLPEEPQHQGAKSPLNESLKLCNELLMEMLSKKHSKYAWPFYKPVDTKQLLDYHEIVKTPMDLGTVKQKMDNREYETVEEFEHDVMLIFSNCVKYTLPGQETRRRRAKQLEEVFVKRMAEMMQKDEASTPIGNESPKNVDEPRQELKKEGENMDERAFILGIIHRLALFPQSKEELKSYFFNDIDLKCKTKHRFRGMYKILHNVASLKTTVDHGHDKYHLKDGFRANEFWPQYTQKERDTIRTKNSLEENGTVATQDVSKVPLDKIEIILEKQTLTIREQLINHLAVKPYTYNGLFNKMFEKGIDKKFLDELTEKGTRDGVDVQDMIDEVIRTHLSIVTVEKDKEYYFIHKDGSNKIQKGIIYEHTEPEKGGNNEDEKLNFDQRTLFLGTIHRLALFPQSLEELKSYFSNIYFKSDALTVPKRRKSRRFRNLQKILNTVAFTKIAINDDGKYHGHDKYHLKDGFRASEFWPQYTQNKRDTIRAKNSLDQNEPSSTDDESKVPLDKIKIISEKQIPPIREQLLNLLAVKPYTYNGVFNKLFEEGIDKKFLDELTEKGTRDRVEVQDLIDEVIKTNLAMMTVKKDEKYYFITQEGNCLFSSQAGENDEYTEPESTFEVKERPLSSKSNVYYNNLAIGVIHQLAIRPSTYEEINLHFEKNLFHEDADYKKDCNKTKLIDKNIKMNNRNKKRLQDLPNILSLVAFCKKTDEDDVYHLKSDFTASEHWPYYTDAERDIVILKNTSKMNDESCDVPKMPKDKIKVASEKSKVVSVRRRLLHLLAVKPYTYNQLFNELTKTHIKIGIAANLDSFLTSELFLLTVKIGNQYYLLSSKARLLEWFWPFYSKEERQIVNKRMLTIGETILFIPFEGRDEKVMEKSFIYLHIDDMALKKWIHLEMIHLLALKSCTSLELKAQIVDSDQEGVSERVDKIINKTIESMTTIKDDQVYLLTKAVHGKKKKYGHIQAILPLCTFEEQLTLEKRMNENTRIFTCSFKEQVSEIATETIGLSKELNDVRDTEENEDKIEISYEDLGKETAERVEALRQGNIKFVCVKIEKDDIISSKELLSMEKNILTNEIISDTEIEDPISRTSEPILSASSGKDVQSAKPNTMAVPKEVPKVSKDKKGNTIENPNVTPLGPKRSLVAPNIMTVPKGVPKVSKDKKGNTFENPNVSPLGPRQPSSTFGEKVSQAPKPLVVPKGVPKVSKDKKGNEFENPNVSPLGPRQSSTFGERVSQTPKPFAVPKGVPKVLKDKKGNTVENPNVSPLGPRKICTFGKVSSNVIPLIPLGSRQSFTVGEKASSNLNRQTIALKDQSKLLANNESPSKVEYQGKEMCLHCKNVQCPDHEEHMTNCHNIETCLKQGELWFNSLKAEFKQYLDDESAIILSENEGKSYYQCALCNKEFSNYFVHKTGLYHNQFMQEKNVVAQKGPSENFEKSNNGKRKTTDDLDQYAPAKKKIDIKGNVGKSTTTDKMVGSKKTEQCRYGKNCQRPGCWFAHDVSASQSWGGAATQEIEENKNSENFKRIISEEFDLCMKKGLLKPRPGLDNTEYMCLLCEQVTSSLYSHVTQSYHRFKLKSTSEADPPKKQDARMLINDLRKRHNSELE